MKNDLFVDTAGWAYYLDRRDPLHLAIVALMQQTVKEQRHSVRPTILSASGTPL